MGAISATTNKAINYIKLAVVLFAGLYCYLCLRNLHAGNLSFTNDIALSMAVGAEGLKGDVALLGPPSHRGGRHLGPIYYQIVSLVQLLSGSDTEFALKLFSYLSLLFSLLLVIIAGSIFPGKYGYLAALATLIIISVSHWPTFVRYAWHAHTLLLTSVPLFALFMSGQQKVWGFWLFLILASLSLQMHFSSLPMLLAFTLLCPLFFSMKRVFVEWRKGTYLLAAVFVLLWLPTIFYQIEYANNLKQVADGAMAGDKAKAGLLHAMEVTYQFFLMFTCNVNTPAWLSLTLVGCLTLLLLRRLRSEVRVWVLGLPFLFMTLFLARLTPPLMPYFLYALLPAMPLSFAFGLICSVEELESRFSLSKPNFWSLISALFIGCFVSMAFLGLYSNFKSKVEVRDFHTLLHAQEVAQILRQDAQGEYFSLFGNQASKFNRDAILYILGKQYYSQMAHVGNLKELPGFDTTKLPSSELAYALMCPKPYSKQKQSILQDYEPYWSYIEDVDLVSCTTCANCFLAMLRRNTAVTNN